LAELPAQHRKRLEGSILRRFNNGRFRKNL
jgi:hypothetical protein